MSIEKSEPRVDFHLIKKIKIVISLNNKGFTTEYRRILPTLKCMD